MTLKINVSPDFGSDDLLFPSGSGSALLALLSDSGSIKLECIAIIESDWNAHANECEK